MKETELKSILGGCDKNIEPSREIIGATAEAAHAAERMRAESIYRPKRMRMRALLVAAATMLCVILMAGAGFKVFEYIYFHPGKGIMMDDGSTIISVLERAVKYDDKIYIEACSLERSEDGTNKLTIITNNPYHTSSFLDIGVLGETVTAEADGKSYALKYFRGGSGSNYYICDDFPQVSSFRVGSAEIELTPINASKFATVEFPTRHGITFIAFPLSEGSSMLAYTFHYKPEEDGTVLPELANLSESVYADLIPTYFSRGEMTVTDVLGNTYRAKVISGSRIGDGMTEDGYLNGEHVITLDRRLEADVASISVGSLTLEFHRPKLMDPVTFTVPEFGETVEFDKPFIDKLGFYDAPRSATFTASEINGKDTLQLYFDKPGTCGIDYALGFFPEYSIFTGYEAQEDEKYAEQGQKYVRDWLHAAQDVSTGVRSDISTGEFELTYSKTPNGKGPNAEGRRLLAGDTVTVKLHSLFVEISGDWTINFGK